MSNGNDLLLPKNVRDDLVLKTRKRFGLLYPTLVDQPYCLHWAWLTLRVIQEEFNRQGVNASAILQGGTAAWRCVSKEDDDGKQPTHYGHHWLGKGAEALNKIAMALGALPEMHCWVGLLPADPKTPSELVDVTVGKWPEYCPLHWSPSILPPDYLWESEATNSSKDYDACYIPDPSATMLAYKHVFRLVQEGELP